MVKALFIALVGCAILMILFIIEIIKQDKRISRLQEDCKSFEYSYYLLCKENQKLRSDYNNSKNSVVGIRSVIKKSELNRCISEESKNACVKNHMQFSLASKVAKILPDPHVIDEDVLTTTYGYTICVRDITDTSNDD